MTTLLDDAVALARPRWDGTAHRMEVWYLTATDEATGTGYWVHYETVAPTGGRPYAHGWTAVFPRDGAPVVSRFGPEELAGPAAGAPPDAPWFRAAGAELGPGGLRGRAEVGGGGAGGTPIEWDLTLAGGGPPLYTFDRPVWERELLPGAQVVPVPTGRVTGSVTVAGDEHRVAGPAGLARIYGHGSAQRWGWLHADLGGGEVLEIVTATARRRGLRRIPPLAAVQLRLEGEDDWPARALIAAPMFRTRGGLPRWQVSGVVGRRRLRVEVTVPPDRSVRLTYTDPDGATATCTNSEVATAVIVLERLAGRRWTEERAWTLDGTAHAEVGTRP